MSRATTAALRRYAAISPQRPDWSTRCWRMRRDGWGRGEWRVANRKPNEKRRHRGLGQTADKPRRFSTGFCFERKLKEGCGKLEARKGLGARARAIILMFCAAARRHWHVTASRPRSARSDGRSKGSFHGLLSAFVARPIRESAVFGRIDAAAHLL